jgi:hypothetical protein
MDRSITRALENMIYVSGPCISAYLKNRIFFCYRALFFADTVGSVGENKIFTSCQFIVLLLLLLLYFIIFIIHRCFCFSMLR